MGMSRLTPPETPREKAQAPVLEFFIFDAGGGHRSAANALNQVIADKCPDWHVKVVNLQELLRPVDPIFRFTKMKSENVYNEIIKRGWTLGSPTMLRALQAGIRMQAPAMGKVLQRHWQGSRPDMVVSLIPNFNKVLFQALRKVHPEIPYVTVMTDIADYPPHFWQEKQDQYIICGSDMAVEQARAKGYTSDRIFQTSGMILKPSFYQIPNTDRREGRKKLGLDPDLPTALIMFGGNGSKDSVKILERLDDMDFRVQSIVMCGNNKKLKQELDGRPFCHAVGFVDNVAHYMRLADWFMGKPGPGCISEAIASGLPVIVERNKFTLPQERPNTKWVEQNQVGIVVKSFKQTKKAVRKFLKDNAVEVFRANAARVQNTAVFDIPAMLEKIMNDRTKRPTLHSTPASASRRHDPK